MSDETKWIMSLPPDGQQQKMTEAEIRQAIDVLKNARNEPIPPCAECGAPAIMRYYRDGRWRCERHFWIAFHDDFGRWPGEE